MTPNNLSSIGGFTSDSVRGLRDPDIEATVRILKRLWLEHQYDHDHSLIQQTKSVMEGAKNSDGFDRWEVCNWISEILLSFHPGCENGGNLGLRLGNFIHITQVCVLDLGLLLGQFQTAVQVQLVLLQGKTLIQL